MSLVVLEINELGRPQDPLGLGWWQLLSVTLGKSWFARVIRYTVAGKAWWRLVVGVAG